MNGVCVCVFVDSSKYPFPDISGKIYDEYSIAFEREKRHFLKNAVAYMYFTLNIWVLKK